jgi:MSHA biogenesis protein MshL
MNIKRSSQGIKIISVAVTVLFTVFGLAPYCPAQMDVSAAATGAGTVAEEAVKEPLPQAGNVTVNFKDVDIKTVLHYLSEVSGVDIVPSPGVDASVTMRLRDKPWEVALDIVTRNYGYVYSSDEERGIIRVMPKSQLRDEEPITEVIPLNHMIREIELTREGESEEVVVQATQESILQLMMAINSILNVQKGERATYISGANAVVVTAIPARISEVKGMVAKIDKKSAQIVLDAKVIEVRLDDDERFGVDWNAIISAAGAARPITFPFTNQGDLLGPASAAWKQFFPRADGPAGGPQFPFYDTATLVNPMTLVPTDAALFTYGTLDFSTFSATLRMIEQRSDTQVLSSPRITTLNNQKATIKVVEKIMLQKTQETTQTAGIVTVEFEKESEAREVGIKLTVIPHVNEDGDISVNLLPEVSNRDQTTGGFDVIPVGPNLNAIALTFNSREANTIVRVRDGETIFIGGLIRENIVKTDNRFPILGDLLGGIPVLGNVFKYESEVVEKTEIVFFVTVYLVKDAFQSIEASRTIPQYDKYIKKSGTESSGESAEKAPQLKTGTFKTKQERVEVTVEPLSAEEKKTYKPFLDFRKKTDTLSSQQ